MAKKLPIQKSEATTAAQAITRECWWCSGVSPKKCWTIACKLSPVAFQCRSSVKRIKLHCLECAARDIKESERHAVQTCTGHVIRENGNPVRWNEKDGAEHGVCWLHPYRFGKNPARKPMSEENRLKAAERGRKLRATKDPGIVFGPQDSRSFPSPGKG